MSLFGSALGAITGVVGNLIGGSMQAHSASKQAELEARLQRENWEYAQKNAHQFEVEDLKNAGLNPILSANHSQLASMPAVSIPSGPSAYGQLGSNITSALNSALSTEVEKSKVNLEKEKVKLAQDRLDLDKQVTAIQVEKQQKEIEQIDQSMSIAAKDYLLREKLSNADYEARLSQASSFRAAAAKYLADADLSNLEKRKLEIGMKYGYVLASYLPAEAREFVGNNIISWIKDNEETITKFVHLNQDYSNKIPENVVKSFLLKHGIITNKLGGFHHH